MPVGSSGRHSSFSFEEKGLNMRKLAIFLPLLAGLAAAPAFAQDGITFRAEGRVGYDEPRAELTVQNSVFNDDFGVHGVMFGAEAGVDARFSNIVIGGYAGVDISKADDCVENPFSRRSTTRVDTVCLDAGRNLYAGGRIGIAIGDGTLPIGQGGLVYLKGGVSRGKFAGSYNVTSATAGQRTGLLFSGSDTVGGIHFGGGFEVDVTPNVYVKGEYVQHRYNDAFKDLLNLDLADPNPLRRTDRFEPKRHQLVFGVGFRFGGHAPAPEVVVAPPVAAPVAPAPATQTCADGSVILATDACPAAPAPMPAPQPERG
jgi:outer membrane immunogenic protein